ncbi:unnamed protein product [Mytilus edulis]|uniref:Mutator-like transposase domain-containing protein n=1 Tax=Mytilus edulis TaxID=6550 RepID=A0A8S3S5U8_MYTED|nr:unnamed protein product [Mytilus edulis]
MGRFKKGGFSHKKYKDRYEKVSEAQKKRWNVPLEDHSYSTQQNTTMFPIGVDHEEEVQVPNSRSFTQWREGRRVVELGILADGLRGCAKCGLPLQLGHTTSILTCGLSAILKIPCSNTVCRHVNNIPTGKRQERIWDANVKLASASINAGLGERQVNTLLSGLNIPPVSHCMMSARQKDVGVALQEVAKETVDQALCEEVELTKRHQKLATREVREGVTYSSGIGLEDHLSDDIEEIPSPSLQPAYQTIEWSTTVNNIFFDIEATGLGEPVDNFDSNDIVDVSRSTHQYGDWLCKVKLSDTTTAAVMLNDLQNKGFIKEVEKGFWMRIQSGGADAKDEVQIVKNIPRLTSQEQPTIAVITSLYCEKLAVDALIDNKTTFVKYKTEGESQVYSVGRIGRHKIVSTKLSKDASSPENSKISTENSVTRLLGTFSKVQHVFLVGVGGSVPDYDDASKHVRLGDIVVSLPPKERSCLYVHCQKVEHTVRTDEFKFNVKHWACADDSLQKVAEKIRKVTDSSSDTERPWDIYLEEASERLKAEESSFHRPFINTDRLYYTNPDGTVVEVQHPSGDKNYIEGRTNVRFGAISNGMNIAKDGKLRKTFARLYGIKAYDLDTDAILESLEGNRNESFLIIRGLQIMQMEAVKSGNHIVPWPLQLI